MTTQCDAGCSRVATTKGTDGADYCPACHKASKAGRRAVRYVLTPKGLAYLAARAEARR